MERKAQAAKAAKASQSKPQQAKEAPKRPPKTLPKPSPNTPKSTPNRSKRPLRAHRGPVLYKSSPSNTPNMAKKRQKRSQTGPNPPQVEPKTLPNPFFKAFCGLFFPIQNLPRFFIDFLLIFCYISRAQCMKNTGLPMGKRYILQDRHFQEKLEKSLNSIAKSFPNPPKILPKSVKHRKILIKNAMLT